MSYETSSVAEKPEQDAVRAGSETDETPQNPPASAPALGAALSVLWWAEEEVTETELGAET